jgi:hypothetical protein
VAGADSAPPPTQPATDDGCAVLRSSPSRTSGAQLPLVLLAAVAAVVRRGRASRPRHAR